MSAVHLVVIRIVIYFFMKGYLFDYFSTEIIVVQICLLKQSVDELVDMAKKYYDEIALPKLVILSV